MLGFHALSSRTLCLQPALPAQGAEGREGSKRTPPPGACMQSSSACKLRRRAHRSVDPSAMLCNPRLPEQGFCCLRVPRALLVRLEEAGDAGRIDHLVHDPEPRRELEP